MPLSRWNLISLKMHNGFTADYVHITELIRVKVGQRVRARDVMSVGDNRFSRPHLHFEIHQV